MYGGQEILKAPAKSIKNLKEELEWLQHGAMPIS